MTYFYILLHNNTHYLNEKYIAHESCTFKVLGFFTLKSKANFLCKSSYEDLIFLGEASRALKRICRRK